MKKYILDKRQIFIFSSLIIAIDQITKYIAVSTLENGKIIEIIPGVFQLRLVKNTGAAFSLLNNSTILLTFISFSVAAGLIIYLWGNTPLSFLKGISLSFLLGGTLGNGIDRISLGYVNDFIDFIIINFPIFNLADIAINISIIGLLIHAYYSQR